MSPTEALRQRWAEMVGSLGGPCMCSKRERRAVAERLGSLVLTKCNVCGGFCSPEEDR